MKKDRQSMYETVASATGPRERKHGLATAFPRATRYAAMLSCNILARETRDVSYSFPYSERHLQCVWFDSSLRPGNLVTDTGEQVIVEDPGRWNLEAGPDFLDAVLIIGPERRRKRGDVEIHIHPAAWKSHNHGSDKAYANLIAHVSYFPGSVPEDLLPKGTVQISLQSDLKTNQRFSFESIDITAYPYSAFPAEGTPCATIAASWNADNRIILLEAAGEERLKTKAARVEKAAGERGADQVLYEEVMAALGYKHNSMAFRKLAGIIPLETLGKESDGDPLKGFAMLLGISGLIPLKVAPKWDQETRSFVRRLWDHWWKHQAGWETRRLSPDEWKLSGLRPQNSPIRRLAAAAAMFATGKSLSSKLSKIDISDPDKWHHLVRALFVTPPVLGYWNDRLSFSGSRQKTAVALVGNDRIAAIESNVFLPFLATRGIQIRRLLNAMPPEHDNSIVRQTANLLFGRDQNPSLYSHGLRQQGLIQIFHDFCINNRSACRTCKLPEAMKTLSQPH